jgi:threonyl-tRNA synthetase
MMDHREIGQKLDLFMFHELSPGCPIWLPKGTLIYNLLAESIRELNLKNGYNEVRTPIIWKSELYRQSGHMDHYRDNMFHLHDPEGRYEYNLKPMNCPGHMLIFQSKQWSYNDLPYRIHDQGVLHRNETSGAIGGLTRCRAFCQDDGHVFLTEKQIGAEVEKMVKMVHTVYECFNMSVRCVLSTRPDGFMGTSAQWDNAEAMLTAAIHGSTFTVDHGGGAFYGPKIDFIVKDSQDREWQTATIQLDFQLPQRFKLEYTAEDGSFQTPVVIHRAYYGSFERFIGIVLEHYQGDLPLWLAPVQVRILPISDKHLDYAKQVQILCEDAGLRAEVDSSNRRVDRKIVDCEQQHIPYTYVVGSREEKDRTVSVRCGGKDIGANDMAKEIENLVAENREGGFV